jgi:hypothetical protein
MQSQTGILRVILKALAFCMTAWHALDAEIVKQLATK